MNKKGKVLLASAAAGLVTLAVTAGAPGTARAEEAKVKCYGANTCKGTGECGGKCHSCGGKNTCAGQGWTMQTKDACLAMKGGRLTPEPEGGEAPHHEGDKH